MIRRAKLDMVTFKYLWRFGLLWFLCTLQLDCLWPGVGATRSLWAADWGALSDLHVQSSTAEVPVDGTQEYTEQSRGGQGWGRLPYKWLLLCGTMNPSQNMSRKQKGRFHFTLKIFVELISWLWEWRHYCSQHSGKKREIQVGAWIRTSPSNFKTSVFRRWKQMETLLSTHFLLRMQHARECKPG